jgi:hypothetical protein
MSSPIRWLERVPLSRILWVRLALAVLALVLVLRNHWYIDSTKFEHDHVFRDFDEDYVGIESKTRSSRATDAREHSPEEQTRDAAGEPAPGNPAAASATPVKTIPNQVIQARLLKDEFDERNALMTIEKILSCSAGEGPEPDHPDEINEIINSDSEESDSGMNDRGGEGSNHLAGSATNLNNLHNVNSNHPPLGNINKFKSTAPNDSKTPHRPLPRRKKRYGRAKFTARPVGVWSNEICAKEVLLREIRHQIPNAEIDVQVTGKGSFFIDFAGGIMNSYNKLTNIVSRISVGSGLARIVRRQVGPKEAVGRANDAAPEPSGSGKVTGSSTKSSSGSSSSSSGGGSSNTRTQNLQAKVRRQVDAVLNNLQGKGPEHCQEPRAILLGSHYDSAVSSPAAGDSVAEVRLGFYLGILGANLLILNFEVNMTFMKCT